MKPWQLLLLGGVLLLCPGVAAVRAAEPSPLRRNTPWHELSLPPGAGGITDLAVDSTGVLWGLLRGGLYAWDGQRFHQPDGGPFRSGVYVTRLIGGSDRPLYVTQVDERANEGKLFRLHGGKAEYVTEFSFDDQGHPPAVYVTRAGWLLNWSERFLAIFRDGTWHRHELEVGAADVQVAEIGNAICLLGRQSDRLYVIAGDGSLKEVTLTFGNSVPLEKPPRILPWGEHRLLALSDELRRVLAFDMAAGEPVDTTDLNRQLESRGHRDLFGNSVGLARRDGSVWLRTWKDEMYAFFRISPGGDVTHVEGTSSRAWSRGAFVHFPNVHLETRDGAMWFALDDSSLARHQAGKLQRFDWRDGLSYGKFNHLSEGKNGEVYAASLSALVVWRPDDPRPTPQRTHLWSEFESASYRPIRDARGNVWMMLRDRPGEIARWDGTEWHHQSVSFDTTKIYHGMADDQGHILLSPGVACHDISPGGIQTFPDVRDAVLAAVARGVKRFDTDASFQGCIVDGNQIWMGKHRAAELHHYDGEQWTSLSLSGGFGYLLESAQFGVLVTDADGGKFYTVDRGRLKYITASDSHTRWLSGSKRTQPYESELLDRRPQDYVVLQHGRLTIRVQETISDGSPRMTYLPGDKLPGTGSVTRGWRDGHWTDYAAGPIYRLLGNHVIRCDWDNTPLAGREYEIHQVLEDVAGNVWICAGRRTFLKRRGKLQLDVDGAPQLAHNEYQVEIRTVDSPPDGDPLRIFWRCGHAPWQGGEATHRITVPRTSPGEHLLEILGMDRLGATTESLHQRLPLP